MNNSVASYYQVHSCSHKYITHLSNRIYSGNIFSETDPQPSTSASLTSIHPEMPSKHCSQTVLTQVLVNKNAKIP